MLRRMLPLALAALLAAAAAAPAGAHRVPSPSLRRAVLVLHAAPPPPAFSLGSAAGCPRASTCDVYHLGRARWPVSPDGTLVLPFRYSDAGRPSTAPDARAVRGALARAAAEWEHWNPKVSFRDEGPTDARPGTIGINACGDGVNTVGWRPLPLGVVGLTALCFERGTLVIREVDTALNSTLRWGILPGPDPASRTFDVQSVLTHELGHWFSLLDLGGRRAQAQTMFESGRPGQIRQRTLALGDIVGLQTAYPCEGCPRSGIADD